MLTNLLHKIIAIEATVTVCIGFLLCDFEQISKKFSSLIFKTLVRH